MKIQTLSIVAGGTACDARCPFCVARTTPTNNVTPKESAVNWRNFHVACKLAEAAGVTTAMITSKGEALLFPEQITQYLNALRAHSIPLVELQTNGLRIMTRHKEYAPYLDAWYELGLITFAISVVHYDQEKKRSIYTLGREYMDLPALIDLLHEKKFTVRLTVIAARDYIDTPRELAHMVDFARRHGVEQLTITPVTANLDGENLEVAEWTEHHALNMAEQAAFKAYLDTHGVVIRRLVHGAQVYDVNGQNVCLNNCLTVEPGAEEVRNLIFFPDGHVRHYWQHAGSIIF